MNECAVERRSRTKRVFQLSGLYCLTDSQLSGGRDSITVVRQMLDGGARIIQYREKNKNQLDMYQECLAIRNLTKAVKAVFFVNDNIALALAVGADGVHVGQDDLPVPVVRKLVGENMIIGLSTHSPEQAESAVAVGADYIGVGPVYPTQTKLNVCDPVGLQYVEFVANHIDIASVAIGGINEDNCEAVVMHGADCLAMISQIVAAKDIKRAVQKSIAVIETARQMRG